MGKLGWREKSILLLMLKGDEPPGKPNPIWFDIYSAFDISYNALPKKLQPKFREERNFRLSMHRLSKRGLVKPVLVAVEGSLASDPRGYGYVFYSLTVAGRGVAEKLRLKEKMAEREEDFEDTIRLLKSLGKVQVTISQVREVLWQHSQTKFNSKDEFDRYWNNTKLGRMLKKHVFRRSRVSAKDSKRKYCLIAGHSFS